MWKRGSETDTCVATVCDVRWETTAKANVEMAVDVDASAVRQFIQRSLSRE